MMNKIDISTWKSFKVSDVFVTQFQGGVLHVPTGGDVKSRNLTPGTTPRISAKTINNGVVGYYDSTDSNYRVYHNFISVSFLKTVFYQSGDASLDLKIHCLKPIDIELNEYIATFLISIIKNSLIDYNYGDQLNSEILAQLEIKLPVKKDGSVDWGFMENYSKDLFGEVSQNVAKILNFNHETISDDVLVDVSTKEFKLTDFFDVQLPKVDLQAEKLEEGIYPLVSSGKDNNGICKFIAKQDVGTLFKSGSITVDMFGKCFYQNRDFYSVSHGRINVLVPKYVYDEDIGLYFVTSIEKKTAKYEFNDMCNSSVMNELKIILPVCKNGEPDFDYMRMCIQSAKSECSQRLDVLQHI